MGFSLFYDQFVSSFRIFYDDFYLFSRIHFDCVLPRYSISFLICCTLIQCSLLHILTLTYLLYLIYSFHNKYGFVHLSLVCFSLVIGLYFISILFPYILASPMQYIPILRSTRIPSPVISLSQWSPQGFKLISKVWPT